jgi:hypothetical protein
MRYPTGFARHVLWGAALLVCLALALRYEGHGLAIDWGILTALVIWRALAKNRKSHSTRR